jgi:deoxyribodipyrimidine photo-lyase
MAKPHKTALYWFRRIIRLDDNCALTKAVADAETVIPVFILDPDILNHPATGKARVHFLFESLADVDASLRQRGGRLIVRRGKPVAELERLIDETGATALYYSRDYEPYSRKRDDAVQAAMQERGVTVETASDHLLVEPWEIFTKAGGVYTVFTPYKRVWFEHPIPDPVDAPKKVSVPKDLASEALPTVAIEQKPVVKGGEAEAKRLLETFVENTVRDYDTSRETPGEEGTSRLSAALRMGVISPRRVLSAARARHPKGGRSAGVETFLSELAWRDFYYQILWHFPHVETGAFKKEYDALEWENDERLFQAWCDGQTGYPIVDAAQRQLKAEAWMHNRARMITASFLTKDLLCDWRKGERHFMQYLVDGDLASNNGGWQWAASTGTDAQPYFRIFNPTAQGEKFDPDGTYVKRWIPELRRVPAKYIHHPWDLSEREQEAVGCVLGKDYPRPIVDHKAQRDRALTLYRRAAKKDNDDGPENGPSKEKE